MRIVNGSLKHRPVLLKHIITTYASQRSDWKRFSVWGGPKHFFNAFKGIHIKDKHMTNKTTQATETAAKRTRTVIKWQEPHEGVTCSMIALFMDNKDVESAKLAMVGRKIQMVLESIAQTVKDGKASKELKERRDNLELALQVAGITNSNVVEALDRFISLFK